MARNSSLTADEAGISLTCPVCLDMLTSPRFLPCHHTLCTDCISDLMERAGPTTHFLCPLCQSRVAIPDEGVHSFQVNFYLAPLLSGKVQISTAGSCQQCLRVGEGQGGVTGAAGARRSAAMSVSTAVATCVECRLAMCRECVQAHQEQPLYARHQFRSLTHNCDTSRAGISCEGHASQEQLAFYCKTCDALVCRPCKAFEHPNHRVVGVAVEAEEQRSEVRRQLMSLSTLRGALVSLQDEGTVRADTLQTSCRDILHTLDTTREKACHSITARTHATESSLKKVRDKLLQVITEEKKKIQERIVAISELLALANEEVNSSDADFLMKKARLVSRIQSVMARMPASRGNLEFSFKMSAEISSLLRQDNSFGYMTVQFKVPILRHRFSLTSTKQHRKLRKISPRSDGRVWASVGNVLVDISEDLVETKRLEFPTEISDFVPAPDGSVYVALVFPQPVKILLPSEQACDFACPLVPPGAMALTDKHELAMAANDGKELSLTFYTVSGARSRRVSIPRPDFFPTSMTFTKRGQVFLCSSAEILCLDADFSEVSCLCDDDSMQARAISTLRGVGSGVGDVLMANGSSGSVEVLELVGNTLERRRNLIEGRRGQDCDVTPPEGENHNISCCAVDRSGRLWVGEEEGHITVYDWLMRLK